MTWLIQNRLLVGCIIILVLSCIFSYTKGYNTANKNWELKTTIAENKALKDEIERRKKAENLLIKEKDKNEKLDRAYAKAIKDDGNYKCIIPDSLVQYLNSI